MGIWLTGNQQPDRSRISDVRRCNLDALQGLLKNHVRDRVASVKS
jgi:hypothetical protein